MSSINSIRFNQDKSCFHCCLDNGLRIYNVEPLVEKVHFDEKFLGSVGYCEMVYRCNLFAIVSGGHRPKYADNTVLVYDDVKKRSVLEFTFTQPVLAIRCRRDRLVAILKNKIHIFSFPNNPQKLFTIETRNNPTGLCELSPGIHNLLVFPGFRDGSIQVVNLTTTEASVSSCPVTINAHQGEIACLSINQSGSMIATASDKGTLIRVWDSQKRALLNELRRGSDPATLYCINFSLDSDFLCCSSDKGTIHIFAIKDSHLNRRSTFSKMGFLGNYIESQWALANFTVPPECACICAFASHSSVVAICMDGTFHKYVFNSDGQCSRLSFDVFLDVCGDEDF
ncbi:unnamed protein product [Orchesella dallaii]|uniref:WD repeat domain phosphoinositide-interacting protein 4 n=1 Tax=Orchesella dallaii TaxID=48710 RepID=A0ABP1R5B7_9HEXA